MKWFVQFFLHNICSGTWQKHKLFQGKYYKFTKTFFLLLLEIKPESFIIKLLVLFRNNFYNVKSNLNWSNYSAGLMLAVEHSTAWKLSLRNRFSRLKTSETFFRWQSPKSTKSMSTCKKNRIFVNYKKQSKNWKTWNYMTAWNKQQLSMKKPEGVFDLLRRLLCCYNLVIVFLQNYFYYGRRKFTIVK